MKVIACFFTLIAILSICIIGVVFAGTTGKIVGKVTDAESGQPLVGVNVIIEGTNIEEFQAMPDEKWELPLLVKFSGELSQAVLS